MNDRRLGTRRKSDRLLHGWASRIVIGYVILMTVAIVGIYRLQTNATDASNRADRTATALKASTIAGCERLNVLQVKDNVSHYADWKVFTVVLSETLAAPPPMTAADREGLALFVAPLRQAVRAKTWTPTLDCTRQVRRHGTHYLLPTPIPFDQELPPRSALVTN